MQIHDVQEWLWSQSYKRKIYFQNTYLVLDSFSVYQMTWFYKSIC
jgi:hypothetical protein